MKFEKLANDFFENLDKLEFGELEKYVLGVLKQHEFYETAHVAFSDGGIPSGTTSRKAYYSPQLEATAVIELSQDWDDYYDYESNQIEYRDFYHIRVYLYSANKPFTDNDLYFLGDYTDDMIFSYSRNDYNDRYVE